MENIIQLTLEEYNEMRDGFLAYQKSQRTVCSPVFDDCVAERDTTHDECVKENHRLCKIRGEQDEEINRLNKVIDYLRIENNNLRNAQIIHPYYQYPIYGGIWSGSTTTTNQGDFDKMEGKK